MEETWDVRLWRRHRRAVKAGVLALVLVYWVTAFLELPGGSLHDTVVAGLDLVFLVLLILAAPWAGIVAGTQVLLELFVPTQLSAHIELGLWTVVMLAGATRRRLRWLVPLLSALWLLLVVGTLADAFRRGPLALLSLVVFGPPSVAVGLMLLSARRSAARAGRQVDEMRAGLVGARHDERHRLAADLHEAAGAQLVRARALLEGRSPGSDAAARRALLDDVDDVLRAALSELRVVLSLLARPGDGAAEADLSRAMSPAVAVETVDELLAAGGAPPLSVSGGLERLARLDAARRRTLVRVLTDGVVPVLRSSKRLAEARVQVTVGTDVVVAVHVADEFLTETRALQARLELLGSRVERERGADGSVLVFRIGRRPDSWRNRWWGRGSRWRLVVAAGFLALVPVTDDPGFAAALAACALAAVARVPGTVALVLVIGWGGLSGDAAECLAVAALAVVWARTSWLAWAVTLPVQLLVLAVSLRSGEGLTMWMMLAAPADVLAVALAATGARERRLAVERASVEGELAAVREEVRVDLARELHDVVAHHLSVATLQIMGHRHSDDVAELDLVLDRVGHAVDVAARELGELGRVMEVGEVEEHLVPSEMGRRVVAELEVAGHPVDILLPAAVDELAPSLARTVSRVLQESATNALRYAPAGSPVVVRADVAGAEARMSVTSGYAPGATSTDLPTSGFGLRGLADRIELLGGEFAAGPVGDVWVVRASLPVE